MLSRIATAIAAATLVVMSASASALQRERTEEPARTVVVQDRWFELRDYKPMVVAEVTIEGERRRAQSMGFRRLAAYIFAYDRPGEAQDEEIAMTSPVLIDQSQKIAMTAPVLVDEPSSLGGKGPWRTRFVMPAKYTLENLPQAPKDITLAEIPARRLAVAMFNGYGRTQDIARMEAELREWLEKNDYSATGPAEYAFYDSPRVPGPYRRNEVMIPVAMSEVPAD